jgi:hypothetical protein
MKTRNKYRRDAALTLAATVAALGTAVGVAPGDIVAAELATPAPSATQWKLAPAAQNKKLVPTTQDKWRMGNEPAAASTGKIRTGQVPAVQDKHRIGAAQQKGVGDATPGANQSEFEGAPGAKAK